MRNARDFDQWKSAAIEMDNHLGLDTWKLDNQSGIYYDSLLVEKVAVLTYHIILSNYPLGDIFFER